MMMGAIPKGRRSAPPKLAWAPIRAPNGIAPSAFLFSARWRLSRDCCAASHWNWWRWRVDALWPTGGRDDEPDTLALLGALVWHGACCARVEVLARQGLSLSQGHAAEYERPSSWPRRRMLGRGTGRAYPPAHSGLPPSRRGLPQVMGAVALCWRSHEPASCATGDARERPARAASRWTQPDQATRWDDHHRQGQ